MKFKKKELSLKSYAFYMMFLEMTKMLTKTLIDINYDKGFKLYTTDLIDAIKDIAMAVEQASESNIPEYHDYVKKFSDILAKYSVKNEDDTSKIDANGNITIKDEYLEEYKTKLTNLMEEYSSTLQARQKEAEAIKTFMDKEISITVPLVPFELVSEYVTPEQMKYLRLLIDRED